MNGKRERPNSNTEEGKDITKRHKIDLAPRIAVNNKHTNAPINVVRFQTPGTTADSIVSKALLTARSRLRHDAAQQQQQQHQEQSTNKLKTRQDKRTQKCLHNALQIMYSKSYDSSSTSSCAGGGGGATNGDGNNKCVEGSSNVSSLAATTLLDDPYFKQIQTKLNSFKSRRKLISDACDNILEDSTKRSEASSGVSHNWLKVVQDSKDKSSTFSVSPITKESSIVCESSQLGSLQVDKCTELKKDREDQSTCNQQAAKPSPARTVETLPTVGSYIGSVEIDSSGNEQRKQTLPTADNVCIDRVESEMTTSNESRKDRLLQVSNSPIPCVKSSPMSSVANSFAQSMTTNATGDDSDEDTNVFDMLRTTFNNVNESDTSEENEEEKEVQLNVTPHRPHLTPMSSRPPLSPKPPMNSAKQISKKVSKSQQHTSIPIRTTPKTSPKIYRGTPNSSMMSGDSILDSSVGDATQDTSHDSTCQQQLEYSFLASALVATSMLATPIKESDDASESIQSDCSSPAVAARSNGKHIPLAPQHSPLPPVPATTTANKRSHQELNYSSTGATLSSNKDPLSLTFDNEFDEDKPRKKQRTPTQSYNEDFDRKVEPSVKLTEDDDTPVDSSKSDEKENALSKLESRIKVLEENQMMPNREIAQLKEKQSILESRLDEEMTLKEEAAVSAQDMHKVNEDCLRQKIQELEADLESERAKVNDPSESSTVKDLKKQLNLGKKANNKRIVELQQTITELTSRRHMLEKELVSCGKENDHLKRRLIKLTDDKSIKEYTIATAYNQLKSLSENYYLTKSALKDEREATKNQKNEVSSLQTTLHQMAKKMNALEVENEELKSQLSSMRFMPFCRGSTK